LTYLDHVMAAAITTIHRIADQLRLRQGDQVRTRRARPPRCLPHGTSVPCSGMNHDEPMNHGAHWFGMRPRQRRRQPHCAERADRAAQRAQCSAA